MPIVHDLITQMPVKAQETNADWTDKLCDWDLEQSLAPQVTIDTSFHSH